MGKYYSQRSKKPLSEIEEFLLKWQKKLSNQDVDVRMFIGRAFMNRPLLKLNTPNRRIFVIGGNHERCHVPLGFIPKLMVTNNRFKINSKRRKAEKILHGLYSRKAIYESRYHGIVFWDQVKDLDGFTIPNLLGYIKFREFLSRREKEERSFQKKYGSFRSKDLTINQLYARQRDLFGWDQYQKDLETEVEKINYYRLLRKNT